jgi:hypothetical protein
MRNEESEEIKDKSEERRRSGERELMDKWGAPQLIHQLYK